MTRIATALFFIILLSKCDLIFSSPNAPVFYDCGPPADITEYDLTKLFSSLTSEASSSNGFATAYVDTVIYGLIMCYGDATSDDCTACLDFSTYNATVLCPDSSRAVFSYEWCFLRYEDWDFISELDLIQQPHCNRSDYSVSDSISMENNITDLLSSLTNSLNPYLYAYDNRTYSEMNYSVYAIVQCTRDLLAEDCNLCLQYTIVFLISYCSINYRSMGVRIQLMSCYIRYELYALNVANNQSVAPMSEPSLPNMRPSSPANTLTPPTNAGSSGSKTKLAAVAAICAFGTFLIVAVAGLLLWRRKKRNKINTDNGASDISPNIPDASLECGVSSDFRVFQLSELEFATNMFSEENKLGQGGFGPVYKGTLRDGKQTAVKRLAGWSKQGHLEFKNEVDLLAKLRHKNLVKLLGYYLDKNEKLLCYEYMPCGSLDCILFATDQIKRGKLSWQTRYKIIKGISSGLQYLHIESGSKIIHRDLKPSNILLDEGMNPKISDFGLARLYQDDQTYKETSIIAGTYGYMAPEYAMHGMYSEKLDVYSFGILLLEIVTGRKNCSFCNNQLASNLINYAWQHWAKGELEVLKDPALDDTCLDQLSRCIHIGLLCVQESPINRPNMDAVTFMLRNDSIALPALPRVTSSPGFLQSHNSMSSINYSDFTRSDYANSSVEAKSIKEDNMIAMLPR